MRHSSDGAHHAEQLHALGVGTASADDDAARKQLKYQDKPGAGGKKCINCTLFEAPSACSAVPGKISPNGWCVAFAQK